MSEENPILDDLVDEPSGQGENPEQKSDSEAGVLDPEIQKRDAQIAHWREKARKLEEQVKTVKPQESQSNEGEQKRYDPFEAVKLGKILEGYSESETDFILRNAKSKNIQDIQAAVKDDMVQSAIMSRRDKVAKENKVPSSSSSSQGFAEKSYDDIEKMSRDEHKKFVQEFEQNRGKNEGI